MPLSEIVEQHVTAVKEAINYLRYGYPHLPYAEQCRGSNFRWGSGQATRFIAQRTIEAIPADQRSRVVVMLPWRAGLAFVDAYKAWGVTRFIHVNSKRNEHTLATMVDFECGSVGPDDIVVIADPALGTGNTFRDAIVRLLAKGVLPWNIWINAVVAANTGIDNILGAFPFTKILVGAIDPTLNAHGMIEPGLGDYGDKYFHGMTVQEKLALAASLNLDFESELRLIARLCSM